METYENGQKQRSSHSRTELSKTQFFPMSIVNSNFELYGNLTLHTIERLKFLLQSLHLWLPLDMLVHMAPLLSERLK